MYKYMQPQEGIHNNEGPLEPLGYIIMFLVQISKPVVLRIEEEAMLLLV